MITAFLITVGNSFFNLQMSSSTVKLEVDLITIFIKTKMGWKQMIINLLGGGPDRYLPEISQAAEEDQRWIGVDRGVFTLLSKGIQPYAAFGDFDSVNEQEWQRIERSVKNVQIYRPEKDQTDMELALDWALAREPNRIHLYGATGGRLDHFFGNIQLLLKAELQKKRTHIEMIDTQNHVYVKGAGRHKIEKKEDREYISFIPVTPEIKGLTLEGFKYPLTNSHISFGSTLCISNELVTDSGTFSFSEGILMVIRSKD